MNSSPDNNGERANQPADPGNTNIEYLPPPDYECATMEDEEQRQTTTKDTALLVEPRWVWWRHDSPFDLEIWKEFSQL